MAVQSRTSKQPFRGAFKLLADDGDIPADVQSLIARHIDSVVQLELLLLLHRGSDRAWTANEIATELRIEPAWTASQLERLSARQLIRLVHAASASYRYVPATPELAGTIDRLARVYADRRVSLTALIYSKPVDTLRSFAEAFRFRKDPKDG